MSRKQNQSKGTEKQTACCFDEIHVYNVTVCAEIGGIAECNAKYTADLSHQIAATGKTIMELTIRELIEIHSSYGKSFNRLQVDQGGIR